jgi:hypothetical protein
MMIKQCSAFRVQISGMWNFQFAISRNALVLAKESANTVENLITVSRIIALAELRTLNTEHSQNKRLPDGSTRQLVE